MSGGSRPLEEGTGSRAAVALCCAVALVIVGMPVCWGAGLGDSLLYAAYLVAFVLLPGIALTRALDPRGGGGPLRTAAIGSGVGYLLANFAFSLTAELGVRDAYWLYPVIVLLACGVLEWRRRGGERPPVELPSARVCAGAALVFLAASATYGVFFFDLTPLPGGASVAYFQDYTWTIALAADALHHWPMMDPGVAGEAFPYHNYIHLHVASATQVTGIDLPVVFFRLWFLPVIAVATIQFVAVGRSVLGSHAAGLGGAALTWLVGGVGLAFTTFLFLLLAYSPSFLYGMVVFLPLVMLIGERLDSGDLRKNPGAWVLMAILIAGAPGAKISILPLLLGALGLLAVYSLWRDRRLPVISIVIFGLVLIAQGYWYLDQYRGHSSGLGFDVSAGFEMFRNLSPIAPDALTRAGIDPGPSFLRPFESALAAVTGFLAMLGPPLAGLWWAARRSAPGHEQGRRLLAMLALTGLLSVAFLRTDASSNQLYFTFYGLSAGFVLSAWGLIPALRSASISRTKLAWLLFGWGIAVVLFLSISGRVQTAITPNDPALAGLLAFLWAVLALVAVAVGVRYSGRGGWGLAAVAVAGAMVIAGVTDAPSGEISKQLRSEGDAPGQTLSPAVYGALSWIRDNSDVDDVFMVNNQGRDPVSGYPVAYDYPAFAERRAWLAGWGYATAARNYGFDKVVKGGTPFEERERLNELGFQGDPEALEQLRRAGVRFAVIDETRGTPADLARLRREGEVVFEGDDAVVIDLGETG